VSVARVGADGTLASASLISIKANAFTRRTVAQSLVRAFHVSMSFMIGREVETLFESGLRSPLGGYTDRRKINLTIVVKISLSGINESNSKLASSLRAVVSSPVSVAAAGIVSTTSSMSRAHVVTFSSDVAGSKGKRSNSKQFHFLI
jgi:hypothetical protein